MIKVSLISDIRDWTTHGILYVILGYSIYAHNVFRDYKRNFQDLLDNYEQLHHKARRLFEDTTTKCEESYLKLDEIEEKLLSANTDQDYDCTEMGKIRDSCYDTQIQFESLMEESRELEQDIKDSLTRIQKTMREFQKSRIIDKRAYTAVVSSWAGIVGFAAAAPTATNDTRYKAGMFAVSGAFFGMSLTNLINKCTSHEKNGMNIVWDKMKIDLANLQHRRIKIFSAVDELLILYINDYNDLAQKNFKYSHIKNPKSDNRMTIQTNDMLKKTDELRKGFIEFLSKKDPNQQTFEIKEMLINSNAKDLVKF